MFLRGFQRSDNSRGSSHPSSPSRCLRPATQSQFPCPGSRRSFDFLARHAFSSLTLAKSSRLQSSPERTKNARRSGALAHFSLRRSEARKDPSVMPAARKKRPGGATSSSSPARSVPKPARRRPGEQAAEKKMRERRSQDSDGLDSSAAVSSPPLRAPLLLFPMAGYHRSIFKEDPEAICQISCKQGYLAMAQAPKTVLVFGWAQDQPHQPLVESRSE